MDAELKLKVCRLIAGLVVADSDLAPEEDAFIERMLKGFGIEGERDSIFPIVDRDEAVVEVKTLPREVQEEALSMLLEAAAVDGVIADEERDYLRAVGGAMGLDEAAIEKRIGAALAARARG